MVVNNGPSPATEIALTDSLPSLVVFVAASVTIVVQTSKAGQLSNTATVTATQPDPSRTDNTATETTTVF